ncbi:hypothetical protein IMSAGC021_00992 [Muribaculaceae bacterium]|nr:hypothetical protein IMSAGC021_00992 [Muribaculaceae bacterium]
MTDGIRWFGCRLSYFQGIIILNKKDQFLFVL